jgi:hypothetical protein
MKYKEIVDDIQVQFKSHNESIKTQNPYWILFRFLTEINSIRDELLQKITSKDQVPSWMQEISLTLYGSLTNSGNKPTVYDSYKFSIFTIPDAYYSTPNIDILDAVSTMHQKKIYIETPETVMLRIKSDDDNLNHYIYGFLVDNKLYLYPFVSEIYVYYIPKLFCGSYESVSITSNISAPDFIISEARKRVVESVILQKQIPEDDRPDGKDQPIQMKNN